MGFDLKKFFKKAADVAPVVAPLIPLPQAQRVGKIIEALKGGSLSVDDLAEAYVDLEARVSQIEQALLKRL